MAEIGLKVLSRQCLDRRIGTIQQLSKEVHAWLSQREKSPTRVKWQFTTASIQHYYIGEPLVARIDCAPELVFARGRFAVQEICRRR